MNKINLLEEMVLEKIKNYKFEVQINSGQTKLTDFGFKKFIQPSKPDNLFKYGFKKKSPSQKNNWNLY